ncbi:MAG TPA: hypothetical protein VGL61_16285 [Kofleriaceae bacterium]
MDLQFAANTVVISHVGLEAHLADGRVRVVPWREVVGVVARRLPAVEPYRGETFVDVISTAGSTIRILPWTSLIGHVAADGDADKARAIVRVVTLHSPDAQLDPATRVFLASSDPAAQLPDAATLAAHDARLA